MQERGWGICLLGNIGVARSAADEAIKSRKMAESTNASIIAKQDENAVVVSRALSGPGVGGGGRNMNKNSKLRYPYGPMLLILSVTVGQR